MRHTIWYRVLISLWAVWFSTALIEPAGLFACAMHSAVVPVSAAPATDAVSADAPHHDHGGAAPAPERAEHAEHASTPQHDGHPCCTCLGQCSTMTATVLPRVDVTIELLISRQASMDAAVVLTRIPLRPAHALPFANGPPITVRS